MGCPEPSGSDRIANAVAARFLPSDLTSSHRLPHRPVAAIDWHAALGTLIRHNLTGFAVDLADDGDLVLSPSQRQGLLEHHRLVVMRVLWLERVLVETVGQLEEIGVDVRVLKGASLAHTVYPNPQLRQYVDVDLLVHDQQFDEAVETLIEAGSRRVHEEPRRGFVARFGKSAELVRVDGASIDLHCSLSLGVHALRVRSVDLFATASRFELAGRQFQGLGSAERFLHACYHATVGNAAQKLVPYLDVVLTLGCPDLDVDRVEWLRRRWGAEAVTAAALTRTWEVLRINEERPLLTWARGHRPSAAEARLAQPGTDGGAGSASETAVMLRSIPGVRNRAAYLASLLVPSRAYRAERGQSLTGRFTAAARRVSGAERRRR